MFTIQQLFKDDLETFKSIRLEALRSEPKYFGSSFEVESQFGDTDWLGRLTDTNQAYFALRVGTSVVGLTGILTDRGNPSRAILIASFIRSEYRRMGGSALLYRARLDWAVQKGFAEIVVSHRASNEASRIANQKHGFVFTHTEPHIWNDGESEDNVFYKLELFSRTQRE